jgi:hypothetical protein
MSLTTDQKQFAKRKKRIVAMSEWSGILCVLATKRDNEEGQIHPRNDESGGQRLSRVFVVKSTVEEIHDNLQHWGAKAYFVACFSTKDAETLGFCSHRFLVLALGL